MPPTSPFRLLFVLLLSLPSVVFADHWVATWVASPAPQQAETKMQEAGLVFNNQTVREIVHVSLGGRSVRVRLSNAYGANPVRIAAAHLAMSKEASQTAPGSDRTLTFNGRQEIVLPPDASALSDPVDFDVPAEGNLTISLFLPDLTMAGGIHYYAQQTSYIGTGDQTGLSALANPAKTLASWVFLSGVDVSAPDTAGAVVTLGDSITDGIKSTPNANHRWPNFLALRLRQQGTPLAVVNAGIGGNRLLHDSRDPIQYGVNALARFDRDVLTVPGVRMVIVLEGINDLGQPGAMVPLAEAVSAEDVIGALSQLISRAHEHGLKIFGATITPFAGTSKQGFHSPEKERQRNAINAWIRDSHSFDGVIDFDRAVRDPDHAERLRPAYDGGDHLHPGDRGYEVMAQSVDLSFFQ